MKPDGNLTSLFENTEKLCAKTTDSLVHQFHL